MIVGSYNNEKTEGLYDLQYDAKQNLPVIRKMQVKILNPSYVIRGKQNEMLYAVSESADTGSVYALRRNSSGEYDICSEVPSYGKAACHLAISQNGDLLAVSNYMDGVTAIYALAENGDIKNTAGLFRHEGKGINPDRQECSHAHFACFLPNGKRMLSVDLGCDVIYVYDVVNGNVIENGVIKLPDGCGPRHFVVDPLCDSRIFVLCELACYMYTIELTENGGVIRDKIAVLPTDIHANAAAAAIKISHDGKYLYTSTRIYGAEDNRGFITTIQLGNDRTARVAAYTRTDLEPRDIELDDMYLYAACMSSDSVMIYERDADTGMLHERIRCNAIKGASCITL